MRNSSIVSEEYSIAATEVLDILNFLPKNLVSKIPNKLLSFFEEVRDKDYNPQFDYSQGLENIKLTDKGKALLAMIYRNYLCSEDEKKEFDEILFRNEQNYQNQLREKYNPDKIFQNNMQNEKEENNQTTQLIEYREKKWYNKIFEKICKLLKKSN